MTSSTALSSNLETIIAATIMPPAANVWQKKRKRIAALFRHMGNAQRAIVKANQVFLSPSATTNVYKSTSEIGDSLVHFSTR